LHRVIYRCKGWFAEHPPIDMTVIYLFCVLARIPGFQQWSSHLCTEQKSNFMKTVLLIKEIYTDGFRNLGNFIVKEYFKVFAWFCFAMYVVVLYAFLFRLVTGFAFD